MSGNMLTGGMPQANPLLGPGSASQPVAPAGPQSGPIDHAQLRAHITHGMRGMDQSALLRKRDAAGEKAEFLQGVMTNPDANVQEIERYLGSMVRGGHFTPQEAVAIMRTLPRDGNPAQVRQWAQMMFSAVAHVGVHLHAAFPQSEFPGAQQSPQQPQAPQQPDDDEEDAAA